MLKNAWSRRISIYIATLTMTGFGLTGVASAQTITNTGPGSQNDIRTTITNDCRITNNNSVSVSNTSSQNAASGNADESDNTGSSWGGWAALNPTSAQNQGANYDAWWNHVAGWVSNHASGSGWNGTGTNLSWTPSGNSWSSYDPLTWQANGQSFGNWYAGVESYLDANNASWLLGWPANATGGFGGASTGNALNSNNANFSITINNHAHADVTPRTICTPEASSTPGQPGGGMGGGPSGGSSSAQHMTAQTASNARGGGSGSSGGASGTYNTPRTGSVTTASMPGSSSPSNVTSSSGGNSGQPGGGMGGGPSGGSSNSISNTGPGSSNTITTATNNYSSTTNTTCVSVTNYSNQSATTGNASSTYNTTTSGGGSGGASNANSTAIGTGVSS